jgi:CTD kinase subunit beta
VLIGFSYLLLGHRDMLTIADSHRTVVGLEYPPHAVGLACIYLASLLATFELNTTPTSEETIKFQAVVDLLSKPGEWETKYLVKVDDLAGTVLILREDMI